jgi:hypothetical protein
MIFSGPAITGNCSLSLIAFENREPSIHPGTRKDAKESPMKLRIKGNSLRLRVSPSEMERLLSAGGIEEIVHFAPDQDAKLTYALELEVSKQEITVRYRPQEVTVVLSSESVRKWARSEKVGIYGVVDVGCGQLTLAVEKDFACLDGSEAGNEDSFTNPNSAKVC